MRESSLKKLTPLLASIKPMEILPTGAEANYTVGKEFKAIVFDIYGTLIISASGDIMQSTYDASMFYEALSIAGFKINVPQNELMKIHQLFEAEVINAKNAAKNSGIPFPELNIVDVWSKTLNSAENNGLIAADESSDVQLYTFIFELKSNQVWPMPELSETLKHIKTKNIPMGIVSNAQFYTPIIMNYFLHQQVKVDEFIDGFEKDLSVFSYKMLKGKPDTAIYEALLKPLKSRSIDPTEVLYVGNDMLKDIYAASQLGFKTCFYAGDQRAYRLREDHPQASQVKPDFVITELKQLTEILK